MCEEEEEEVEEEEEGLNSSRISAFSVGFKLNYTVCTFCRDGPATIALRCQTMG